VPRRFHILVCRGPECGGRRDSAAIFDEIQGLLRQTGPDHLVGDAEVTLDQFSCFGRCRTGPNVLVRERKAGEADARLLWLMPTAGGILYGSFRPLDATRLLSEHIARGQPLRPWPPAAPAIPDATPKPSGD